MRITRSMMSSVAKLAEKLDLYSVYCPTPLSLKSFVDFGYNAPPSKAFQFLRHEIPIRLANIMKEISLLPVSLISTDPVQHIIKMYEQSFEEMIYFESQPTTNSVIVDFMERLKMIHKRHAPVIEFMALGIRDMKNSQSTSLAEVRQLQYFLDRFYMSRIGIRMLITQQVKVFMADPVHGIDDHLIGCINPHLAPMSVACEAYSNAAFLCQSVFGLDRFPRLEITLHSHKQPFKAHKLESSTVLAKDHPWVPPSRLNSLFSKRSRECILVTTPPYLTRDIELTHVPNHVFAILFELLKNAMRAVVEAHDESANMQTLPSLKMLISEGVEDVVIKIHDEGQGVPLTLVENMFDYTFTTCEKPLVPSDDQLASRALESEDDRRKSSGTSSIVAGYGHGLPISRLHARYLSGDLQFTSIEGLGSMAYVYLKRDPMQAHEILPVFNRTSERFYKTNSNVATSDWTQRVKTNQSGAISLNSNFLSPSS